MRSSAHVGRQGMALLIGGKGVLEDRLERDERHRCLRTRGRRRSSGGFLQYHANYPRCKRLVQPMCMIIVMTGLMAPVLVSPHAFCDNAAWKLCAVRIR